MEVSPSFPLNRLPAKVIIHFIRTLNFQEMIAIASLSRKSKSLCKTANHKARIARVTICRFIHIVVARDYDTDRIYFRFHYEPEDTQLATPTNIRVGSTHEAKKMNCRSLEIDLIFEFFERRSFRSLVFRQGCEQLDLGVVKQKLKPFERLEISHEVNNEYSKKILTEMVKDANTLSCFTNPYRNPEDFQKFLVQNLQEFEGNFTLDDLLICNSSMVYNNLLNRTNLSEKNINQFLKLWRNGASRNLKTMVLTVGDNSNVQEILRGLSYREFPNGQRRIVERAYPEENREIFGGFDICRVDGTKGSICFDARGMVFYVWS